ANGGFKNIAISNCVFDHCRGLALESVDGGDMGGIVVTNLAMRDIGNAPLFIRLGAPLRGPAPIAVGAARRITSDAAVGSNVAPDHGILISGVPGHAVEEVSLSHILILYRGGGTTSQAARDVPEYEADYPEPSRFGVLPSYGLFARHVKGLSLERVELRHA